IASARYRLPDSRGDRSSGQGFSSHSVARFHHVVEWRRGPRGHVVIRQAVHRCHAGRAACYRARGGRVGLWARARSGFEASDDASLSQTDRFSFGNALSRTNADKRAAEVYATVKSPASLANAALYQRARALLAAGDGPGARAALRALSDARDTSAAAALALTADLQTDDGDDVASRQTLLGLIKRFPSTRFAAPAQFDAALVALILGQTSSAAKEFATLARSSSGD